MTDMVSLRKTIKGRKPTFLRQDAHKMKRLKNSWRKPKGSDSKMRWGVRGYRRCVTTGWGSPLAAKFLNRKGKKEVVVRSLKDLASLDTSASVAVIASNVGQKTRVELVKSCVKKGIAISNLKDVAAFEKKVADDMSKRKEKRKSLTAKKVVEKKEKKKDIEEKVLTEEEKKEQEKQEKDKILTQRDL